MKAFLFMAALFFIQTTNAGPVVSAGMPGALKCSDRQKVYNFKIIYLEQSVGLSGTRAMPIGSLPLDFICEARYQPVLTEVSTMLLFVCKSKTNSEKLQIFRNTESGEAWGLHIGETKNGIPRVKPLRCEDTQP